MVGWHHQLKGHEFEQALGDSGRQRSLVCCSPWGQSARHDLVTELQVSTGLLTVFSKYDFRLAVYHSSIWPSAQLLNSSAGGDERQSRNPLHHEDRVAQ